MTLYTLTHSDWWMFFCGLCAFAVTMALLRNISQQRPDVLPKPDPNCIAKGEPAHYVRLACDVGVGHVRTP